MNVLERLEALAEKGAPRPWRHSVAGWVFEGTGESSEPVAIAHEVNGADVRDENANLIVAAVNALPDLVTVARVTPGLPAKLEAVCAWLDLLDGALDALQEEARGELRRRWDEARSPEPRDEIQRDLRALAATLRSGLEPLLREAQP